MDWRRTTDGMLVERYRKGDKTAFDDLVRRHCSSIYAFSRRYSGDPDRAADITQEVFVKAWKNIGTFDTKKAFKPWIFAIAKNTALDWLRKKEATPFSFFGNEDGEVDFPAPDDRLSLEEFLDAKETASRAKRVLSELPKRHSEVVLMHHEDELTFKEIASILKEPLHTVKSRYRRAIRFVKEKLQSIEAGPR